jgi:hypothetical protein
MRQISIVLNFAFTEFSRVPAAGRTGKAEVLECLKALEDFNKINSPSLLAQCDKLQCPIPAIFSSGDFPVNMQLCCRGTPEISSNSVPKQVNTPSKRIGAFSTHIVGFRHLVCSASVPDLFFPELLHEQHESLTAAVRQILQFQVTIPYTLLYMS